MISSFRFGFVRSFLAPQEMTFALPDGTPASGYNVIVGANNSGKSTIIKMMGDLLSFSNTVTIGSEARHNTNSPIAQVDWFRDGNAASVNLLPASGSLFTKSKVINCDDNFRYVPSRRPFGSEYDSSGNFTVNNYERTDHVQRARQQGYFDGQLASVLAKHFLKPDNEVNFLNTLKRIDHRARKILADNLGGRDVLLYESLSGNPHLVSDTGLPP